MCSPNSRPIIHWGVVATGQISSWFVRDIALSRPDAKANHILQAIGSSSVSKGEAFVQEHIPHLAPAPSVYGSYAEVYADPRVDIVYVGTPHSFHKQNCLDAISAGKHVLCEKPFAVTSREAREVFAAAKQKGVFVMEAVWTRFFPLVDTLKRLIHEEKIIGDVHRTFCDLSLDLNLTSLDSNSRLKARNLGAGSLLDVGIYSLTWGLLTLEAHPSAEPPTVMAVQSLSEGVDIATSVLMHFPSTGRHGILTSSSVVRTPKTFCRIEGPNGCITVEGVSASAPSAFEVHPKTQSKPERYEFDNPGIGLFWEADAVALDIMAGRTENSLMPWKETIRLMAMMDNIRRQGGARYPQDDSPE